MILILDKDDERINEAMYLRMLTHMTCTIETASGPKNKSMLSLHGIELTQGNSCLGREYNSIALCTHFYHDLVLTHGI